MSAPDRNELSLWDFAVAVYAAPGVADACLMLQDRHGCDANVLLFAAWTGAVRHRRLPLAEIDDAVVAVKQWNDEVVRPLRALRRRLKSGLPPAPDGATKSLRTRIKAAEMEAEQIELSTLEMRAMKWHGSKANEAGRETLGNLMNAAHHFAGGEASPEVLDLVRKIAAAVETKMSCRE